jgi:hypothetical protein
MNFIIIVFLKIALKCLVVVLCNRSISELLPEIRHLFGTVCFILLPSMVHLINITWYWHGCTLI